jgi:hypothetical protein
MVTVFPTSSGSVAIEKPPRGPCTTTRRTAHRVSRVGPAVRSSCSAPGAAMRGTDWIPTRVTVAVSASRADDNKHWSTS